MAKKSAVRKAYDKERRRIQNYISRYKRRGFEVNVQIPSIPKTVTEASIRRLQKITPDYIQRNSRAIDLSTGEILTGMEALARGRKRNKIETEVDSYRPGTKSYSTEPMSYDLYSETIVANFLDTVSKLPPRVSDYLTKMIMDAMRVVDVEDIAEALMTTDRRFDELSERMSYDSEGAAEEYSSAFLNAIPNISTGLRDDLELAYEEYSW